VAQKKHHKDAELESHQTVKIFSSFLLLQMGLKIDSFIMAFAQNSSILRRAVYQSSTFAQLSSLTRKLKPDTE